eukprot:4315310-Prymnesium_polylepis.1
MSPSASAGGTGPRVEKVSSDESANAAAGAASCGGVRRIGRAAGGARSSTGALRGEDGSLEAHVPWSLTWRVTHTRREENGHAWPMAYDAPWGGN